MSDFPTIARGVTAVTGSGGITSTGGTTPDLSIAASPPIAGSPEIAADILFSDGAGQHLISADTPATGVAGDALYTTGGPGAAATAGVPGTASGEVWHTTAGGGAGSAAQAAGPSADWHGGSGDAGADGGGGGAGTGNVYLDVGIPSGAGVAGGMYFGTGASGQVPSVFVIGAVDVPTSAPGLIGSRTVSLQTGTKATLIFPGNIDCLHSTTVTGVQPTVQTVADGGGGQSVTGAGTDAIVIHYTSGVTTLALYKALFPVAVSAGNLQVLGGTVLNILTAPGDTHAATPMVGGAAGNVNAAAALQVINIGAVLPTNARFLQLAWDRSVAFDDNAGGTASCKVGGTVDDAILAAATALDASGKAMVTTNNSGDGSFSAQQLTVTVTSSGPDLNTFDAGTAAIRVVYYRL